MSRATRIKNKLIAQNSIELPQLTSNTAITLDANKNIVSSSVTASELSNVSGTTAPIQGQIDAEKEKIDDHIADLANPHSVTKDQVGLGNVDNTSDLDKPISTATQNALDDKQDSLGFTPENITNKSTDVNLGTSDSLYPSQKAVKSYVDSSISSATIPDATTLVKGKVKLAGDLSGTADAPTVPGLALKYDASNPAGYVNAAGAASAAPVQSVNTQTGNVVLGKADVGLGNVDNTSDINKPISTATQTALNSLETSFAYSQVIYVRAAEEIVVSSDCLLAELTLLLVKDTQSLLLPVHIPKTLLSV